MSHPKRVDRFREWSKMMMEQAIVPERLEYKGQQGKGTTPSKKTPGRRSSAAHRKFRRIRRNRRNRQNRQG